MAQALEQQLTQSGISAMSFEERLALLVDREVHGRQDRRCARLLKTAKLKYPQATIEDLDSHSTRGLERSAVMSLALGEWVKAGYAVLITGATGAGKSWPVYVLANHRHLCLSVAAWFEKGLAEGFGKNACHHLKPA
jgi:DNA replication protein DnaC